MQKNLINVDNFEDDKPKSLNASLGVRYRQQIHNSANYPGTTNMKGLYWVNCPASLCKISVSFYFGCLTVCLHQGHSTQQPWGRRQGDNLEDSSAPRNQTRSAQSPWPWGGSLGLRSPCR